MDRFADFSDQPMDVTYAAHDDNWLINIVMELTGEHVVLGDWQPPPEDDTSNVVGILIDYSEFEGRSVRINRKSTVTTVDSGSKWSPPRILLLLIARNESCEIGGDPIVRFFFRADPGSPSEPSFAQGHPAEMDFDKVDSSQISLKGEGTETQEGVPSRL